MDAELPQPYSIDEIRRYPFAVAFSIVVGLLMVALGIIIKMDIRENELIDKEDREKTERIKLYESMIFYKDKSEMMETQQLKTDSLVREKTGPWVNKILRNEK